MSVDPGHGLGGLGGLLAASWGEPPLAVQEGRARMELESCLGSALVGGWQGLEFFENEGLEEVVVGV